MPPEAQTPFDERCGIQLQPSKTNSKPALCWRQHSQNFSSLFCPTFLFSDKRASGECKTPNCYEGGIKALSPKADTVQCNQKPAKWFVLKELGERRSHAITQKLGRLLRLRSHKTLTKLGRELELDLKRRPYAYLSYLFCPPFRCKHCLSRKFP